MARRTARFAHVWDVGAWVSASPRVQRGVAALVCAVMVVGFAGVIAHRRGHLQEPLELAAAVGPVDAVVAAPPQTPEIHRSSAQVSRSKPAPKPAVRSTEWARLAPRIRGCESGSGPDSTPNYKAENLTTSASGAYQIVDSTWDGRFGVDHASDATPEQQDAAADDLYRRRGTADWAASAACWRTK